MNKKTHQTILAVLISVFLLALGISGASAEESRFRRDFSDAYAQNKFEGLAYLIKQNKKLVPAEVQLIIRDAMAEGKTYAEKMEMLDLANTMATMHREWNKDDGPITLVEKAQKEELRKENERAAEAEKWAARERFTGNFVMMAHRSEEEAKGLAPVIYPHWMHRLLYECRVCHTDVFQMKRGSNSISHAAFDANRLCGTCHDGKTAFSTAEKNQCVRCHTAGNPGEEKLLNPAKADLKTLKDASVRIGSTFSPEKLKNAVLPLDRLGAIEWNAMKTLGAYEPLKTVSGINKETTLETRDNEILFEPSMDYIKGVVFSHRTHSAQALCSACHQTIFKDTLGANTVTMKDMSEGRSCGACHGKVAFKFADCNRCHSVKNGTPAGGALHRKK